MDTFVLAPDTETRDRVGASYHFMPALDSSGPVLGAWERLIDESLDHARTIRDTLTIKYVEFEPYDSARAMCADLENSVMQVSTLHLDPPLWTPEQNIEFRIAHDAIGHWGMGETCNPFSFKGEVAAFLRQVKQFRSEAAKRALYTEVIGQAAFRGSFGTFPAQKIGFLP